MPLKDKFLDEILNMPPDKRKFKNFSRIPKKGVTKSKRTNEELIQYLIDNDLTGAKQLQTFRKPGDPCLATYQIRFGSWGEAKALAFGKPKEKPPAPPNDAEYMMKLLLNFNIWTENSYRIARRNRPDIFPPITQLFKEWGFFSNLVFAAKRKSLGHKMEEYLKLMRKLKRCPRDNELKKHKLDMRSVFKLYGSKQSFDSFLKDVERMRKNEK